MGGSAINVLYIAIHETGGVDADIRFGLHYGALGFPETAFMGSVTEGIDAWHYAHDHSSRDSTWDTKMTNSWGSAFTGLNDIYKDALWGYMHRKAPPQ